MSAAIKKFFMQFISPGIAHHGADRQSALQVATAALMLEMMRMDEYINETERLATAEMLRRKFSLDPEQLNELLVLADREASEANGYYQFTSLINQNCDTVEKVEVIENMWAIAMIDGHLDAHELHLMRKIGDLLHIGHADFVAAKHRARVATGLSVG